MVAGDLDSTALKTAEVVTTLQGTTATITLQNVRLLQLKMMCGVVAS